jgi:RNA polymerase sigma-70 factor (ECF subfamily)
LTRYRNRWRFFSELSSAGDDGRAVGYEDALPAADAPDAGEALDAAALAARLEQALRRLPGHQRVPLVLFHFDDMSYEAIAARLGVSLGKIKTDIHRGRLALRQVLADEEGGE